MPKVSAPKLPTPQIMKSVDILDRLHILVMQSTPGHFSIDFECMEKDKQVYFMGGTRQALEEQVLRACADKNANDPNTIGYIQEFIGRMLQKLYKEDLFGIEEVTAPIDDHYANIRKQLAKTGKLS